jgi:hypothetical protein
MLELHGPLHSFTSITKRPGPPSCLATPSQLSLRFAGTVTFVMRKQAVLQRRRTRGSAGPTHRRSLPGSYPVVGRDEGRLNSDRPWCCGRTRRPASLGGRHGQHGSGMGKTLMCRVGLNGGAHVAHGR